MELVVRERVPWRFQALKICGANVNHLARMKSNKKSVSKGFTLIELLVVIAITAVLAGLLFPVLANGKRLSKRIGCLNNIRQIGLGGLMYSEENELGLFADTSRMLDDDLTWLYPSPIRSLKTFTCPGTQNFIRWNLPGRHPVKKIHLLVDLMENADSSGSSPGTSYEIFDLMGWQPKILIIFNHLVGDIRYRTKC